MSLLEKQFVLQLIGGIVLLNGRIQRHREVEEVFSRTSGVDRPWHRASIWRNSCMKSRVDREGSKRAPADVSRAVFQAQTYDVDVSLDFIEEPAAC